MKAKAGSVKHLQECLIGEWANTLQAFSHPHDFAHVVLKIEEVKPGTLSITQRYNRSKEPYRSRTLIIKRGKEKNSFVVQTSKDEAGAEICENCSYNLRWDGLFYKGEIKPEQGCIGKLNDQEYLLSSSMKVSKNILETRDEGLNPKTHEHVWGQRTDAFEFYRKS